MAREDVVDESERGYGIGEDDAAGRDVRELNESQSWISMDF
jgi:hypothetical protein